ncbi:MAG: glycosyltransferase family 2 protein [Opitutaceae bacterium]|jgi:glycosyltransferase involved in cell wall biosynthesis|nr:glycosyltransferase family 2 protein [Opitutaceae bacterium]
MPEVSVILPTCDRPDLVGRALRSVLGQTDVDLEVLLVDSNHDAEPVRTNANVLDMLADDRVRLIEPDPRPFSAASARNAALPLVRGNWVSYLDDDDLYEPGKLAAQLELARESGKPLVLCGYTFVWPGGRQRRRQCDRSVFRDDELLFGAEFMTSLLLHRRDEPWRFDESVGSGDDRIATLELFQRHDVHEVPCVPRALVTVFCQEMSVHKHREAAWWGCLQGLRVARRGQFSRRARRQFLHAAALERAARGYGDWFHLTRLALGWMRQTGVSGWRFVAYAYSTRGRRLFGNG